MKKLDSPLLLAPVFEPRLWGRQDLTPIYGGDPRVSAALPAALRHETIAEAWLTDNAARFLNGPVAGSQLKDVVQAYGEELLGPANAGPRFPILAKFLFTSAWLSVQVHPNDAQAHESHPGTIGKTEMWYVVSAGRKAEYLLGVKPGVNAAALRRASRQGKIAALLRRFRPKPGEAIFLPAGTVHTLGPDLVVFEVEENSDITYRLDDFGRLGPDGKPRPLHVEEGLRVARLDAPPLRNLARVELPEPFGSRRYVLACRYFAVELLTLNRCAQMTSASYRVELLVVLSGSGRVETASGWWGFRSGEPWLIPPGAGKYRLWPRGQAKIFRCYVPNLDEDFLQPLLRRKIPSRTIAKLVFD